MQLAFNLPRPAALIAIVIAVASLAGCAPTPKGTGQLSREPEIRDSQFIAADSVQLPVRIWNSKVIPPEAVIVALHGFNDYSNAFDEAARYWAENYRIYTYAYDQRGFGDSAERGSWAGTDAYVQDLRDFCQAMRKRFPGVPLYVLGSSMGGAISMVAFASDDPPDADGVILSAPAVWARETMPWYQRAALFVGAHTIPWASFTGKGLGVVASDNRDMLIGLGRDPKVIKATQVAAIYGLTNLMDSALQSAGRVRAPSLVMVGELDEIVPNHASAEMLDRLQTAGADNATTAVYEQGWHMLLRDLQRQTVWDDVASWINSPEQALPSGAADFDATAWIEKNR
ncbi:alpha/beta hydrolase [Proteobacteria bacterium 005FR1]|nr:alpha/beta hydrolase [Proteobacteria bacterium 005FR1]